MKKLLVIALAAFVATSCADSVSEVNTMPDANAIDFNAMPLGTTRATLTTDNIAGFTLYGIRNDEKMYMEKIEVSRDESDGSTTWVYNPVAYWPNQGYLNFYSCALRGKSDSELTQFGMSDDLKEAYINHIVLDEDADGLVKGVRDVAYAVNMNETKKSTPVQIFFRHAGSQIVFQLSHKKPKYEAVEVYVEDIRIVNLISVGRYTLPRVNTSMDDDSARGEWDLELLKEYAAQKNWDIVNTYDWDIVPQTVAYNTEAVVTYDKVMQKGTYTTEKGDVREDDGYLNVIPQEITPWDKTNEGAKTQTYVLVKVNYSQNGVCLWPEDGESTTDTEWVAVPLTAPNNAWEQGVRYVYTLALPGGLTLPSDDDTIEPEPVLEPIELSVVAVDGWVDENADVDADIDGNN